MMIIRITAEVLSSSTVFTLKMRKTRSSVMSVLTRNHTAPHPRGWNSSTKFLFSRLLWGGAVVLS
jgi:hypothetical protein